MREANRVRERTAARNLVVRPAASRRRIALDLLRADTTRTASLPTRCKPAAWDDAYDARMMTRTG